MNKTITAVVPVRKNSQRIISKNTRIFADTTLLDLKLKVLKEVSMINKIIVNTDCELSIKIAKKYNLDVHVRDSYYASSEVTNDVHWKHIAETTDTDFIMLAQTTSPLVKVGSYEKSIRFLLEGYDSVNSVSEEKKFLWKNNNPINYDLKKTPKSQDLPDKFSLNFGITIIDKKLMQKNGNVIGDNPKFVKLSKIESFDIDDTIDFEFAEFLYKKLGTNWIKNKD